MHWVGSDDGRAEWIAVGANEGLTETVGLELGCSEGVELGDSLRDSVGTELGFMEGDMLGNFVGGSVVIQRALPSNCSRTHVCSEEQHGMSSPLSLL